MAEEEAEVWEGPLEQEQLKGKEADLKPGGRPMSRMVIRHQVEPAHASLTPGSELRPRVDSLKPDKQKCLYAS